MLIALIFSILNGLFAMSEIAIVSARKARLQARADSGDAQAAKALALANDPSDTLSTVQIFITLISIVSGVIAGTAVANDLNRLSFFATLDSNVVQIIVIVIITYFQLVIGELVPKRIGLNSPETISSLVALPMDWLAWLTTPFVWILNGSSEALLFLLRVRPSTEPSVTPEEVQILMEQGADSGIFEPSKREIVEQVLNLGDRRVNDLMTPRPDVVWLDLQDDVSKWEQSIKASRFSRYPVMDGDEDNIVGIVYTRDMLAQTFSGQPLNLRGLMREPLILPEGLPVLEVLNQFKEEESQIAILIDEYGELQGLMTFNDLLEEIVGEVPEEGDTPDPQVVQREDGSWLVDGRFPIETIKPILDIDEFPNEPENYFHTIGGFMFHYLSRVPISGDKFDWEHFTFEVMDMDGRRVDKVLIVVHSDEVVDE